MTVSFRKSFSAALLSGAVAIVTPALAGGLILAQASGPSGANASDSATMNGAIGAKPADSAARAAGANAAGSMNENMNEYNSVTTPGNYGGMGKTPNGVTPGLRDPNGVPNLNSNNGGTTPTAPPDPLAKKPGTPPQQ